MADKDWVTHECDVCILLEQDHEPKRAYYCDACKAWICERCEYRYDRRARAMLKRSGKKESSCGGCGGTQPVQGIPPFDTKTNKAIAEMTMQERLAFDLRLKSEAVMKWDAPLNVKRQTIQKFEQEYQRAVADLGVQGD